MEDLREELHSFGAQVGATGPVVPVGGRTQWEVGGLPEPAAREVRAPAGVVEFEPAEMTVTCGAGTPVAELQAELAAAGQRVALPGLNGATVGGVLAVGRNGIRRLGDGHIRDVLLRVVYVDAAGQLVRNGGPTVKNVSGFDLCKLMVGSLGTLGILAEVTLRCQPVPAVSRWFRTSGDAFAILNSLYRPTSILWDGATTWVLLEGAAADVAAQESGHDLAEVEGPPVVPVGGRESIRPRDIPNLEGEFIAEVGVGIVHRAVEVPSRLPDPAEAALCEEIKLRFDPENRLNPGRSVLS